MLVKNFFRNGLVSPVCLHIAHRRLGTNINAELPAIKIDLRTRHFSCACHPRTGVVLLNVVAFRQKSTPCLGKNLVRQFVACISLIHRNCQMNKRVALQIDLLQRFVTRSRIIPSFCKSDQLHSPQFCNSVINVCVHETNTTSRLQRRFSQNHAQASQLNAFEKENRNCFFSFSFLC